MSPHDTTLPKRALHTTSASGYHPCMLRFPSKGRQQTAASLPLMATVTVTAANHAQTNMHCSEQTKINQSGNENDSQSAVGRVASNVASYPFLSEKPGSGVWTSKSRSVTRPVICSHVQELHPESSAECCRYFRDFQG